MRDGPEAGLRELGAIAEALDEYQPYHAAHADLLRRTGREVEAAAAYRRAIALSTNARERAFLERRLASLET